MRRGRIVPFLIASFAAPALLGCPAFATDDYEIEADPSPDASIDGSDAEDGDRADRAPDGGR